MIIKTDDEKVVDLLTKYIFEEASQETLMRLMMELIPIIGPKRNPMVLFDENSNDLVISFNDNDDTSVKTFTVNSKGITIT